MYSSDLAFIHNAGFASFAARVAPEVAELLYQHRLSRGTVVEIGCGGGVLAAHLASRGFQVLASDISPAMIRLARLKAPKVTFRVGSLESMAIPRCDAIVSIGEVVTYVPGGLPVLRRFFRRAHDALRPGGLLVFDFIESARMRTYGPKTLRGEGWEIAVRASFNRHTRILTRRMSTRRRVGLRTRESREVHRVRIYSRAAIAAALRTAGFRAAMSRAIGRVRLMPGDVAVVARRSARV